MKKLIETDNVTAAFTAFTHISQAVAPVAESAGKVLIYQSTFAGIARDHANVFRDYMDIGEQAAALAPYVASHGNTKLAYIGEQSDQCNEFANRFSQTTEPTISITLNQTFDPTEKDFRTILLKAKDTKAQALLICAWRSEDILMKQIDEAGMINTPTYHVLAPFLEAASSANNQFNKNQAVSTWYGFAKGTEDPKILDFIKRYEARFAQILCRMRYMPMMI